MAETKEGSHMANSTQEAGSASSNRTQGAVPMVQTTVSSHSMRTTRRAAKNVGKHSRRRRRSQHHVPVIAFVIVAMAVMGAFTYWMTHQVLDTDNGPGIQAGLEVNVNIPDGAGGGEISEILLEAGVINDSAEFFKEVRNLDAETSMKSGSYSFVTGGNVRVGGQDVRSYDLEVLRDSVAMVLQKNVLFSGTIAENIRWGDKDADDEEVKHVCRLACADEFIDKMPEGYNTYIEQGGTNVSGGQKQRLCIARALLKKPKILILDDSTSAVDTRTDALIRKAMKEYIPSTTKIIIAQRTSSVEDADRIIVMDNGTINAIGTSEELLKTNEIYREVYFSQNRQDCDETDLTVSEAAA